MWTATFALNYKGVCTLLCITTALVCAVDCQGGDSGPSVIHDYSRFGRSLEGAAKLETLEMISLMTKSNYDTVQPVRGVYTFVDRFHYPGQPPVDSNKVLAGGDASAAIPHALTVVEHGDRLVDAGPNEGYWEIVTGKVRFALDGASDRYHGIYEVGAETWFVDVESAGVSSRSHESYSVHWTLTPEYMLQYDTHDLQGKIPNLVRIGSELHYNSPIVYRRDPNEGKRQSRIVDVRKFFSFGDRYTWEMCDVLATLLKREADENERVGSEGRALVFMKDSPQEFVTVVLNYDEDRQTIISYDGAVGFNPTRYSASHPEGPSAEFTMEYKEKSGTFFPQKCRFKDYKKSDEETVLRYVRQFSLLELSTNGSIPDKEFSPLALGVPYAGRLYDEINGQLFAFDDGAGFVPATEFKYNAFRDSNVTPTKGVPVQSNGWHQWWLLLINACVLLTVIGVFFVRRKGPATQ